MRPDRREEAIFFAKASHVMNCTDTESEASQVHFRGLFSPPRKHIAISSQLVILRKDPIF